MADKKKKKKTEKPIDYYPENEAENYIKFIADQIEKAPVVKNYHGKWEELTAWADEGKQFYEWKDGRLRLVDLKIRKKTIVINLMKPLKEAIEGKLNFMHQLAGVPNSGEAQDVAASRIATKLISHNDYENDVEALFADMSDDLVNTGNGWATYQWIDDSGHFGYMPILPAGVTVKDGKIVGAKVKVEHKKAEGEVIGYSPSVYNIRPDTAATTRRGMRWLIEIKEVPVSDILDAFSNVTKEEVLGAIEGKSVTSDKFVGVSIRKQDRQDQEGIRDIDATALVAYYWERTTKRFPKGRLILSLGDKLLTAGSNPCFGEIPYWHFGFKKCGNSLWHTGPLLHVQPVQRAFNRMISIISEHIEGWKPKLAMSSSSLIKEGAYTSDSLEIVELHEGVEKPFAINVPELSAAVTAFRDFLQSAFNIVANVHEVSYSQLPKYASRAPASLFSMMLEQEAVKMTPMMKRFNRDIKEMGSFRLRLMEHYYDTNRLIKVVGEGEETAIEYFKGAQLEGNYDVKLVFGVSLHQSKVIQQRLLLELKEAGAPFDWNRIIKLLGMGDVGEELREDVADEARAERENQAFINDTYNKKYKEGGVEPYLHDDHEKHMDVHTTLRKSSESQRWDQKKLTDLDDHIELHWLAILEIMKIMQGLGLGEGAGGGGTGEGETAAEAVGGAGAGGGAGQATPEVAATQEIMG